MSSVAKVALPPTTLQNLSGGQLQSPESAAAAAPEQPKAQSALEDSVTRAAVDPAALPGAKSAAAASRTSAVQSLLAARGVRATATDPHDNPANRWDVSHLFADEAAWEECFTQLEGRIASLADLRGTLDKSAASLQHALDTLFGVNKELSRLYLYAMLNADQDLANSHFSQMRDRAANLWTTFGQAAAFVNPEMLAIGADRLQQMVDTTPGLAPYERYVGDVLRQAAHSRSAETEEVIAASGLVSGTASNLYRTLTNTELPWPTIRVGGEEVRVNQAAYSRLRSSPDREVRQKVYDAFWSAWGDFRGTLGVALQSQLKQDWFAAQVRNYPSAVERELDSENIPARIYDSLVQAANDNLPTLHRYFRLRARMLGVEQLHYYDLYPPLATSTRKFDLDSGKQLVLDAVAPLGQEYVDKVREGLESRWMDAYPRPNKRSGAYSAGSAYDVHPYVLMNYNDDFESVSTLAHEWGHAMHSHLSNQAQPYAKADYATFVAEVASTFNEELLLDHMIENAASDDDKLFYLGHVLEGMRTTFFRQTMFAEFEREIHRLVESGEALSGERFQQIYGDILKKYHGHAEGVVKIDEPYTMEWAYIPHFYRNFYVYQYATSLSASSLLARDVLEGKPEALEGYQELLRSGGSDHPYNLLKKAGVDLASPKPYAALAGRMEVVMDQIEEILARRST